MHGVGQAENILQLTGHGHGVGTAAYPADQRHVQAHNPCQAAQSRYRWLTPSGLVGGDDRLRNAAGLLES